MPIIKDIKAITVLNSRAEYTIKTWVTLDDGSVGSAMVPEGASKGELEAVSPSATIQAQNVNGEVKKALIGKNFDDLGKFDQFLVELDGSSQKQRLGGNTLLSLSMAFARSLASSLKVELYQALGNTSPIKAPVPVFNVLNGGKHAQNGLSFQEFMVIPAASLSFDERIKVGVTVYNSLKKILKTDGYSTGVGDEGGFAPTGFTASKALDYLSKAVSENFELGKNVFLGMDVAAESFYQDGTYLIKEEGLQLRPDELAEYYNALIKKFPIIYLEDPFYEKDTKAWASFTSQVNKSLMVVADDLTVTNTEILKKAIQQKMGNAVIVKPNQVGTVSETISFANLAREAGYSLVTSHRSGDTEDTFVADLALAIGTDFVKFGAPARAERTAKYNRLLELCE